MNYSVEELRDKLAEKVSGLGINSKFKENPAYEEVISKIDNLISQMNMFEAAKDIIVTEKSHTISFAWNASDGRKYSMDISCPTPDTFSCTRVEEEPTHTNMNGRSFRVKNIIEEVAMLDKSGCVTLRTNGSSIDDLNCGNSWCNNITWSEKSEYDTYGVMSEREVKHFHMSELMQSFDNADINSILYIPRQAYGRGIFSDRFESRTLLRRDSLDTARVVQEDKSGIRYNATNVLNQEHGLKNLILNGGGYLQDVVIDPLPKEQVDEMIQRESNPKVREGLKRYATGRENYRYDSAQDKNFVYVYGDVSKSHGVTK